MSKEINMVKRNLDDAISQICENSWLFTKNPQRDFSRNRKLSFRKVVSCLLAMEGGSLSSELFKHFGCSADTASVSAFVQQRNKINSDTFPILFDLFVKKTDKNKLYKGFRLFAADGSDFLTPTNPADIDSFFQGSVYQSPYNLMHLDALYDLSQHTYADVNILGKRKAKERESLATLVERSSVQNAILIADRGYEGYNLMAMLQDKGWNFLIRIQDIGSSHGIAAGLNLPDSGEFDIPINLSLTTKKTSIARSLAKDKFHYKIIHTCKPYDFLPLKIQQLSPDIFYPITFRVVRFKISDNSYKTVVTNLDAKSFPPDELKKLYNMRWGIETSFRELKYTVGLLHFHSKKAEYIFQEVFARLIMYNFSELITSLVVIQKNNTKYAYKVNFSVAVHICRQLLLGNVSPVNVEAVLRRFISPIRPGRKQPRHTSFKHAISFTYRIA